MSFFSKRNWAHVPEIPQKIAAERAIIKPETLLDAVSRGIGLSADYQLKNECSNWNGNLIKSKINTDE
jgi:hypothetical protein